MNLTPDSAIKVGILAQPLDPAPFDVDALTHDVGVEVGGLPPTEVHLAIGVAMEYDVISDLLPRGLSLLKGIRFF